ncbi:MAG: hypothetical protein CL609_01105 [Anaerolineaceae bacterium]|nr:hypothetical protein [Anaerolineaceae bacterium]
MDIPMNVDVMCVTEVCGRSTYLVVNPVNDEVTHIVIKEKEFPYIEHLVPIDEIVESSPSLIRLRCKPSELVQMDTFMETDFLTGDGVDLSLPYDDPYLLWPYSMYDQAHIPLEYEHIPEGEVLIHRGTKVKATDGIVGKVDEFLINPANGQISHLIMREGHLWGSKDITIPVSEISKINDEYVEIKLDKKAINELPTIKTHLRW